MRFLVGLWDWLCTDMYASFRDSPIGRMVMHFIDLAGIMGVFFLASFTLGVVISGYFPWIFELLRSDHYHHPAWICILIGNITILGLIALITAHGFWLEYAQPFVDKISRRGDEIIEAKNRKKAEGGTLSHATGEPGQLSVPNGEDR